MKFDGYRIQAHVAGGKVKLYTRTGLDWTDRFGRPSPRRSPAWTSNRPSSTARSSCSARTASPTSPNCSSRFPKAGASGMIFYAFDLLWLDGEDLQARAVDRPQGEAARSDARPRRARAAALQRAFFRTRQGHAGACLPHGAGGRHFQACRRALSQRPRPRLGEIEMHAAPGIRDRRLSAVGQGRPRHPLAGAGLSQGRQAAAGRPCRHRLFRPRHGRSRQEARGAEDQVRALFRRRRQGKGRRLGEARARCRNRVPFLDERRQYTPGFLPGLAGGQAGRGDRGGKA